MSEHLTTKESIDFVDYPEYRKNLDIYSGLQRIGIYDEQKYRKLTNLQENEIIWNSGLPIAVANSHLEVLLPEENADQFLIAVHPSALEYISEGIIVPRQTYLSDQEMRTVFNEPQVFDFSNTIKRDIEQINSLKSIEKSLEPFRFGYPEYQVYSHYDLQNRAQFDEVLAEGNNLLKSGNYRADREFVISRIDDIAKLHTEVFGNQASSIGYYAGLDAAEITRLGHDPETQIMVALGPQERIDSVGIFTKNPENIDWLNPIFFEKSRETYSSNPIFRIPYVVSSREIAETKSHFNNFLKIAMYLAEQQHFQETGLKIHEAVISYNCSAISIYFTPKIINRAFSKAGLSPKYNLIELNYLAQISA